MKLRTLIFLLFFVLSLNVSANEIEDMIKNEIGVEKVEDSVPQSILQNDELQDLKFSYSEAAESVEINTFSEKLINIFFRGVKNEIVFVVTVLAFLLVSGVYKALSSSIKNNTLTECVNFTVSALLCVFLYTHVLSALEAMATYVSELTGFMLSLMPFLATAMCMQGGGAQAASGSVTVVAAITLIESVCARVVIPLVKLLFAFICAGFVSKINFSALIDFFSTIASKTCTITMSVLSAILYFKHSLAASADGLALRSLKLVSGNFIPIVGGMVSEASSTLISGVKLVKTTLGVFAFAVLLYMTLTPILSFLIKKISLKVLSAASSLLGVDDATKILSSVYSVYHILSALMFSVATFFIIAVAIFVKSGVA